MPVANQFDGPQKGGTIMSTREQRLVKRHIRRFGDEGVLNQSDFAAGAPVFKLTACATNPTTGCPTISRIAVCVGGVTKYIAVYA